MSKLHSHLIAKTRPVADNGNIVLWKDYRITVLDSALFRVEKNKDKIFRDSATQIVWYRDMKKQNFSYTSDDDSIMITTDAVKLVLFADREKSYIVIDNKKQMIDNSMNLMGTYRTLDRFTGDEFIPDNCNTNSKIKREKIKLGTGVCSLNGVALFDDSQSLTLGEDGEIKNEKGIGTDEYIFAYGKNYQKAINALYMITGNVPMVPRYALGNWWSRYHDYTDKEYLTLLNRFEKHNVPLTVATIDMDWHYSDLEQMDKEFKIKENGYYDEFYLGDKWYGWTGYTWNKHLFSDYKSFLKKIKEKNLKITLNIHPATGVRFWDDQYKEMAIKNGIDPSTKEFVPFDFTSTDFINSYFDILHKPYEKDGVEFWWIDWQQGFKTKLAGLDPLWALNHYHFLDSAVNHKDPLILSRYSGIGAHRYPLGFSGDTFITWETLKYLPYFTMTASNVGYSWWSHDIGGHMCGIMDEELYLRHVQFGVFSPINRLHCTNAETMTKEPWYYGNGTGEIAMNFLRLRHKMIPWLYSLDYRTHSEGVPMIEPLYYTYPDEKICYDLKEEYMFGGAIVSIITSPLEKDGFARVNTYIPEGKWTDFFTGDEYEITSPHGETRELLRKLESMPVLIKAGSIIPLGTDNTNSVANPELLEINAYSGNGKFTLYEDISEGVITKKAFTYFEMIEKDGKQILKIKSEAEDDNIIPVNRKIRVVFRNIKDGEAVIKANGKNVTTEKIYDDNVTVLFDYDQSKEYEITVDYTKPTKLEYLLDRSVDVLLRAEGDNDDKRWECYGKLKNVKTLEEYISVVDNCPVTPVTKQRLKETI